MDDAELQEMRRDVDTLRKDVDRIISLLKRFGLNRHVESRGILDRLEDLERQQTKRGKN
jgi:hypothetical protein